MRNSLRARLLLWYVVAVSTILTAFGASVCYLFWRSLVARVDDELTSRAAAVARSLRPAGADAFDLELLDDTREYFHSERPQAPYYAIWSREGVRIDEWRGCLRAELVNGTGHARSVLRWGYGALDGILRLLADSWDWRDYRASVLTLMQKEYQLKTEDVAKRASHYTQPDAPLLILA